MTQPTVKKNTAEPTRSLGGARPGYIGYCVLNHGFTRSGRPVFEVQRGNTPPKRLYEFEMTPSQKDALLAYRNGVSTVVWNGRTGNYAMEKVLEHRIAGKKAFYLVAWAGKWNLPEWRSEVTYAKMNETAILEEYKKKKHPVMTEKQLKKEKKSAKMGPVPGY